MKRSTSVYLDRSVNSKYLGKRVVGVDFFKGGKRRFYPGLCTSSDYTLNNEFLNQHFVVETDNGKTRRFNTVMFEADFPAEKVRLRQVGKSFTVARPLSALTT